MAGSGVQVVDRSSARMRSAEDAVGAALAALGVVLVLLLAVYAHATTTGVAQDVRGIDALLGRVLVVPVAVLAGVVAVAAPVGVLLDLAVRGSGRRVLEAVLGGLGGVTLAAVFAAVVQRFGTASLVGGLTAPGGRGVSVPLEWATLAGLLTVAGPRSVRRPVAWAANAVAVAVGAQLVAGRVSLPGVAVALLLGRVAGEVVRLVAGVPTARAYGSELVAGLHRVGIDPTMLVRLPGDGPRAYRLTTADAELRLRVLDGDRQVIGTLTRMWRSIRLRGVEGRAYLSLRQAAERAALVSHAARVAGVRTPLLLAVGQAQDSMLLVSEPAPGRRLPDALAELGDDAAVGDVLADAWHQLTTAHRAGLAHRTLDADAVLVDADAPGLADRVGRRRPRRERPHPARGPGADARPVGPRGRARARRWHRRVPRCRQPIWRRSCRSSSRWSCPAGPARGCARTASWSTGCATGWQSSSASRSPSRYA